MRFFRIIQIRNSGPRLLGGIKGTDESILNKDRSVPLMYHDRLILKHISHHTKLFEEIDKNRISGVAIQNT